MAMYWNVEPDGFEIDNRRPPMQIFIWNSTGTRDLRWLLLAVFFDEERWKTLKHPSQESIYSGYWDLDGGFNSVIHDASSKSSGFQNWCESP